jgi:hypothetical protein
MAVVIALTTIFWRAANGQMHRRPRRDVALPCYADGHMGRDDATYADGQGPIAAVSIGLHQRHMVLCRRLQAVCIELIS